MHKAEADRKVRNALIALESRTMALFIYGAIAVGVGLAMLLTGVPGDIEAEFGPRSRVILGVPLTYAGTLLIAGSFLANERRWAWWSALTGFILFCGWALAMAVAYAWIATTHGVDMTWPWREIAPDAGRLYITIFYQGIAVLTGMHAVTLLRLGRPPR